MSLTINVNNQTEVNVINAASNNVNGILKGNSVDARNLHLNQTADNAMDAKKNSARKQAMKLISDAWERDEKTARGISDMQDEKAAKVAEIQDLKYKIKSIDDNKELLREDYGVSEDSDEQKDLLLLEKYQNNIRGASYDDFTYEEISRLKELQNTPLTEYQRKALGLNGAKNVLDIEIQKSENFLFTMTKSIQDAKIDQLKSQDMHKAQDAADEIFDAANKDIIGMFVEDAKDHVDDVAEENEKKAEEIKEEKEKQEEKLEKARENREDQEKILKGENEAERLELASKLDNQTVDHVAEAQKSIQKILNDNKLINEDIKGIEIDLNF